MSTGFKEALEREIAGLEKSLDADPRFIKLRQLQRILRLYTPGSDPVDALDAVVGVIAPRNNARSHHAPVGTISATHHVMSFGAEASRILEGQRRSQTLARQRVLEDAENILRGRTEPTKTADLYDDLITAGHEIGGDDPKNNLSAMLSKSPKFRSHRRAGWTLTEMAVGVAEEFPPGTDDGRDDDDDDDQQRNERTPGWDDVDVKI